MATKDMTKAAGANGDDAPAGDEHESDLIDDITTLPRVGEISVTTRVMRTEVAPTVEAKPANIQWRLKPYTPRVKKQMVTMSDLGMTGSTRGGVQASRRKRSESDGEPKT